MSNDYPALLAAAAYINKQGGGELFFPRGKYYIAEYHQPSSAVKDIVFSNCNNLSISGDGAVIKVNGKFFRKADKVNGKYAYSNTYALTPFSFSNCKKVIIKNLEVNGGVSEMKRDAAVVETGGHLFLFQDCQDVTLQNVYVHHAQTDGVYIAGTRSARFNFSNLKSANNARQGMSIIQLLVGNFDNCQFINTGITNGSYGLHAPGAGVDIEPRDGGISVRDIKFTNCIFQNNQGSQFVCTKPQAATNILLDRCKLIASSGKSQYQLMLGASNVVIQNSTIDCGVGNIYPIANANITSTATIKNSTIKSAAAAVISVAKANTSDKITIDNCTIEYTGNTEVKSYFPYIRSAGMVFTNNKVIIPSQFHKKKGPTSLIQNAQIASGNTFYSGGKIVKPVVSYQNTKTVKDR